MLLQFSALDQAARDAASAGIGAALAASLIGTTVLAFAVGSSWPIFWAAFGAGVFFRIAALAALVVYAGLHPGSPAGALLASYALSAAVLLMVEYRHLTKG